MEDQRILEGREKLERFDLQKRLITHAGVFGNRPQNRIPATVMQQVGVDEIRILMVFGRRIRNRAVQRRVNIR